MGLEFQIVMIRGEPLQNIPGKCAEYYGKIMRNKCKKMHGNIMEKVQKSHEKRTKKSAENARKSRNKSDIFVADCWTDLRKIILRHIIALSGIIGTLSQHFNTNRV